MREDHWDQLDLLDLLASLERVALEVNADSLVQLDPKESVDPQEPKVLRENVVLQDHRDPLDLGVNKAREDQLGNKALGVNLAWLATVENQVNGYADMHKQ